MEKERIVLQEITGPGDSFSQVKMARLRHLEDRFMNNYWEIVRLHRRIGELESQLAESKPNFLKKVSSKTQTWRKCIRGLFTYSRL